MSHCDRLTTTTIREAFAEEDLRRGRDGQEAFDDGRRLFARSVLARSCAVLPDDGFGMGRAPDDGGQTSWFILTSSGKSVATAPSWRVVAVVAVYRRNRSSSAPDKPSRSISGSRVCLLCPEEFRVCRRRDAPRHMEPGPILP